MSNVIIPTGALTGFNTPVNIDEVSSIDKQEYKDLNDKSLNRYLIVFQSSAGIINWEYNNYESRDLDYNKASNSINAILAVTANFTADPSIVTYKVDASAGNISIRLDPSISTLGKIWNFKKMDDVNNMSFKPQLGALLDGEAEVIITKQFTSVSVQFDGTNFIII